MRLVNGRRGEKERKGERREEEGKEAEGRGDQEVNVLTMVELTCPTTCRCDELLRGRSGVTFPAMESKLALSEDCWGSGGRATRGAGR
eukprot:762057-Hanusia_phi.AAC.3